MLLVIHREPLTTKDTIRIPNARAVGTCGSGQRGVGSPQDFAEQQR